MSEWLEYSLADLAFVNPTEKLGKGTTAKKVAMEQLLPFTKALAGFEISEFKGGTKFRNGDTLVARITPCLENGKTAFVDILEKDEIGFGSTEFIVLREKKDHSDRQFLFYFSTSPKFRDIAIKSMTGSSGRQRVQTDVVVGHKFEFPPLCEQKKIAEVLASLDDKIDLLHRQNKTLEALAEILFRQTFIDNAQDDWEDGTLQDIIEFNPKLTIKKKTSAPYLEMGNVATESANPIDWYWRDFTSGMRFQNGDTLLARITPCLENGKTCFVQFLEDKQIGWGSTEFIVMRMSEGYHPFISYLIARDKDFREFAISIMSGSSGRQRAQADDLKGYEISIPPANTLSELNSLCADITPKIAANFDQIRTLENLRDTLLPKLMSGEVRIQYDEAASETEAA